VRSLAGSLEYVTADEGERRRAVGRLGWAGCMDWSFPSAGWISTIQGHVMVGVTSGLGHLLSFPATMRDH